VSGVRFQAEHRRVRSRVPLQAGCPPHEDDRDILDTVGTACDEPFGRELRAERLSRVEADPTYSDNADHLAFSLTPDT
jgi:hypothetical protein